jgi:hypothetical protein
LRSPHESCINEKIASCNREINIKRNKVKALLKGISNADKSVSNQSLKEAVILLLKEV